MNKFSKILRYDFGDFQIKIMALAKLSYFFVDLVHAKRYMFWASHDLSYEKLSAELMFQFHKIEKGLCIAGPKRFFGLDPSLTTCALVKRWRQQQYSLHDPMYLGAVEALRAYRERLRLTPPPIEKAEMLHLMLEECLSDAKVEHEFSTPMPYTHSNGAADSFIQLCKERRSVRAYQPIEAPLDLIERSIKTAQLSPSACNRQPWRVHVYRDRSKIDHLLALQNGNAGFGHQLSTLLVISADSHYFFDASERNQPFIDAGLFSMSLILALQSHGLASCCLNWCVAPSTDREAHVRGQIPDNEKIVMFMAVGYADADAQVPRSPRRDLMSTMVLHRTDSC